MNRAYATDLIKPVELSKSSDEFKSILHSLKMCLPLINGTVQVSQVNTISMHGIGLDKKTASKNMLQAWVNREQVKEEYDFVVQNGHFNISSRNPRVFSVGTYNQVRSEDDESQIDLQENVDYYFILCDVAVGKPFVMSRE